MRIMIVDDEAIVRGGMRTIISWEEKGYQLVGEARDGNQALQMARSYSPDIIFVDIGLPGMSGLEFIRIIRAELPNTKFIILSCMDGSEYYKQAIKLGVSEYLMKSTASPEEILEAADRAAEEVLKLQHIQDIVQTSDSPVNRLALLSDFLNNVLNGRIYKREEIIQKLNKFHIVFECERNYILVMSLSYRESERKYKGEHDIAAIGLCNEIIASMACGLVFLNHQNRLCILASWSNQNSGEDFIQDICYVITETVMQCLDLVVTFGISGTVKQPEDLTAGYFQALAAVNISFFQGVGARYTWSPEIGTGKLLLSQIVAWKTQIYKVSSINSTEEIIKILEGVKSKSKTVDNLDERSIRSVYFDALCHAVEIICPGTEKYQGRLSELTEEANTLERLHQSALEWLQSLVQSDTKKLCGNCMAVTYMMEYIQGNLCGKITLKDIAAKVYMHPNSVCRLFKNETNKNLVDYINEKKVEKAKEMLLSGYTVSKVFEILGFSSESYFIRVFKQYTQQTPGNFIQGVRNK